MAFPGWHAICHRYQSRNRRCSRHRQFNPARRHIICAGAHAPAQRHGIAVAFGKQQASRALSQASERGDWHPLRFRWPQHRAASACGPFAVVNHCQEASTLSEVPRATVHAGGRARGGRRCRGTCRRRPPPPPLWSSLSPLTLHPLRLPTRRKLSVIHLLRPLRTAALGM